MIIYGLTGPAGAGKDTAALIMCNWLNSRPTISKAGVGVGNYYPVSFATPMRNMMRMAGLIEPKREFKEVMNSEWGFSWRESMQKLGDWGRNLDPDFWVKTLARSIQLSDPCGINDYIITDVRFDNEAKWLREQGGTIFHIAGRSAKLAEATQGHVSEGGVTFNPDRDVKVYNDSSMEMFEQRLILALQGEGAEHSPMA